MSTGAPANESTMFEAVKTARDRLRGYANPTPIMTSRTLNRLLGMEIYFKCENFQRVGVFKFHGAFHAISQLSDAQKACGVITYSSGNHAQAVAFVSQLLNIRATIVMPSNAPAIKRAATEGYMGRGSCSVIRKRPLRKRSQKPFGPSTVIL